MAALQVLDTGLIFRNPKPHLVSRHAYFPSIVSLGGDELVAAMDIGSAFEGLDVRSYVCRSSDGGKTWSEPRLIFTPDESAGPVSTTCRIGAVVGRDLVGVVSLMDRTRRDEGLSNPKTDGFVQTTWALVRSSDGGQTWSGAEPFAPPIDWNCFECCSPIVALPSGRWVIPTSIWSDWDGRNPYGHRAIAMISDDRGKTWPTIVDVMNERKTPLGQWEQKQTILSDGRLLAVCWVMDLTAKKDLPNRYTFSSDGGESYDPPRATPLLGETCTPIALPGNRVLCVYRRMDKRGLWAHLSKIEGDEWQPLADLPLWGTNVASHGVESGGILEQMSSLRFGYPSLALLDDRTIFAVFWGIEDGISVIRWFRIGVEI